jgi:hypothetical protein
MNPNFLQTLRDAITLVRASEREQLAWENAFLQRLLKVAKNGDWPPRHWPLRHPVCRGR